MPSHAEQLPSEIWLSIFTYLEGHDLVRGFSSLNSYFNSLLRSPYLQIHIRIKKNEAFPRLPSLTWSYINLQNICSLSAGRRRNNCLFQFLRWHGKYLSHLRSLSIYLTPRNLQYKNRIFASTLQQIPALKSIHITYIGQHGSMVDTNLILTCVFGKTSTVTKCWFNFEWCNYDLNTTNCFVNPNLKYLSTEEIPWNKLFCILLFTPELYYLKASIRALNIEPYKGLILCQLRKLNLNMLSFSLNQLQTIKQIAPNVEYLRLRGTLLITNDQLFNEKLWQKLLGDLKYFNVRLAESEYRNQASNIMRQRINDFKHKTWFNWEENERFLIIRIIFNSLVF